MLINITKLFDFVRISDTHKHACTHAYIHSRTRALSLVKLKVQSQCHVFRIFFRVSCKATFFTQCKVCVYESSRTRTTQTRVHIASQNRVLWCDYTIAKERLSPLLYLALSVRHLFYNMTPTLRAIVNVSFQDKPRAISRTWLYFLKFKLTNFVYLDSPFNCLEITKNRNESLSLEALSRKVVPSDYIQ